LLTPQELLALTHHPAALHVLDAIIDGPTTSGKTFFTNLLRLDTVGHIFSYYYRVAEVDR